MEQLTGGGVKLSYGTPLTVERVYKVKKVGVYPMKGIH